MIFVFPDFISQKYKEVLQTINANLVDGFEPYLQLVEKVRIIDSSESKHFPELANYQDIGLCSIVTTDGTKQYLICIDFEQCDKLDLDMQTVEAIILHEFGHLFNFKPVSEITPMKDLQGDFGDRMKQQTAQKLSNNLQPELLADQFAAKFGDRDALLRYLSKSYKKKQFPFVQERISKLNDYADTIDLEGDVRPLITNSNKS